MVIEATYIREYRVFCKGSSSSFSSYDVVLYVCMYVCMYIYISSMYLFVCNVRLILGSL